MLPKVGRMADVSVRPARPADAERIARVQRSTWATAYADLLPTEVLSMPEVQLAAVWLHAVEAPPSPRHRVLVALERDDLTGFAAVVPAEDDDLDPATSAELTALLVEPRWGRRGHASRLLSAAVDGWQQDGTTTTVTWAFERDAPTLAFLAGAGWEPDGRVRGLDTGPRVQRQLRLHVDVSA
jgi:GNAT superfamily N-acetyltransferase